MRNCVALALLGSVVTCAHADSNVLLYGLVDGGVRWVNGTKGGSTVQYSSILAQNKFGLTGAEDIGGGAHVFFKLESGFNSSNGALGTNNVIFSRQSYLGVEGKYGRVMIGRLYSSFEELAIHFDPFGIGGADAAIAPTALLGANFFTLDTRFNNNVRYAYDAGGVTVSASYSIGGVAGNQRASGNYSAAASYGRGPGAVGIGYQRTYNADASQMAQNYYAGGYWQIGPVRAYLSYLALTVSGSAKATAQRRDDVPQGGFVWQVTPAFLVTAAYYADIASNLSNTKGASGHKQTAYVIAEYFLSKRTEVFAEADRNHFSGAYNKDPANLTALKLSPGSSGLTGVSIGILSRF